MSTQSEHGYMLIFRGTDWFQGLSPEQMQQVMDRWMSWFNGLKASGKATAGDPLEDGGCVVVGKEGRVMSDGPFAESKEAIGGYFLLSVATQDEAVAIARQCPGLPHGIQVEVRAVAGCCPINDEIAVRQEMASA